MGIKKNQKMVFFDQQGASIQMQKALNAENDTNPGVREFRVAGMAEP